MPGCDVAMNFILGELTEVKGTVKVRALLSTIVVELLIYFTVLRRK